MLRVCRSTVRKCAIAETFAGRFKGKPVLLDEFRWAVFEAERIALGDYDCDVMSRSYRNSFNRTIAQHPDGLRLVNLGRPSDLPLGLVSRVAVFRLSSLDKITEFQILKSNGTVELGQLVYARAAGRTPVSHTVAHFTDHDDRIRIGDVLISHSLPIFAVAKSDSVWNNRFRVRNEWEHEWVGWVYYDYLSR